MEREIQKTGHAELTEASRRLKAERFQIKFGMTLLNNKGFTLVELLVVVLIIGILAAIALPQYNKAVEKSRATQALSVLSSIYAAQKTYFLENEQYALNFDELSVELPWKHEKIFNHTWHKDWRNNGNWVLEIDNENNRFITIYLGRITGKYHGAGFMYVFQHPSNTGTVDSAMLDKLLCFERIGMINSSLAFKESPGDYCEKIFKATPTTSFSSAEIRLYRMP